MQNGSARITSGPLATKSSRLRYRTDGASRKNSRMEECFIREFSGRWQVRRNHRNRQKGSSNWSISWLNVSRWWGVRPYSRIASRCSRVG